MCDTRFPFTSQSHRIVGHLVISVVVGYFGWKLVRKFFFKKLDTAEKVENKCDVSITAPRNISKS